MVTVFDHPFPELFFCERHFLRPNGTHMHMDCCRFSIATPSKIKKQTDIPCETIFEFPELTSAFFDDTKTNAALPRNLLCFEFLIQKLYCVVHCIHIARFHLLPRNTSLITVIWYQNARTTSDIIAMS